jgi:hypothetical protein
MRKSSKSIFVAASVLALATGAAGAAQAHGDHHGHHHTLCFIDHSVKSTQLSKTEFVGINEDTPCGGGAVVGYSNIHGTFDPGAKTISLQASVSLKGGLLHANFPPQDANAKVDRGMLTGGTGRYAGARGSVKATNLANGDTKVVIEFRNND